MWWPVAHELPPLRVRANLHCRHAVELVLGLASRAEVHRLPVVEVADEKVMVARAARVALHAERDEVSFDAEVEREDVMHVDARAGMAARDARGLLGEVLEGDGFLRFGGERSEDADDRSPHVCEVFNPRVIHVRRGEATPHPTSETRSSEAMTVRPCVDRRSSKGWRTADER